MVTESQIPANELAELYDSFEQLHTLLQRMVDADSIETPDGETHPMERYADAVVSRNRGTGTDTAESYGQQQYARNPFPMAAYRERYGNGDRVEEFTKTETAPLTDAERSTLRDAGLIGQDETFQLPVAPDTDVRLPLFVSSGESADTAIALLDEFPTTPAALTSTGITSDLDLLPVSVVQTGQRLPELVVHVEAVQTDPGSKRDAELIVGDVDGTTLSFDCWTTHDVDASFTQGDWYWLHEARCKAWEKDGTTNRRLSSTKDLVIERLGEDVQKADVRRFRDEYGVRPPMADELEAPSDDESSASASTGSSTGSSASTVESTDSEKVSTLMDDLNFDDGN